MKKNENLIRKLRKEWPVGPGNRVVCATMDEAADTIEALETQLAAARKALEATHEAISEYYRYQYGGEMRGSYDGKPERNALWKSMYKARAALGVKP